MCVYIYIYICVCDINIYIYRGVAMLPAPLWGAGCQDCHAAPASACVSEAVRQFINRQRVTQLNSLTWSCPFSFRLTHTLATAEVNQLN